MRFNFKKNCEKKNWIWGREQKKDFETEKKGRKSASTQFFGGGRIAKRGGG